MTELLFALEECEDVGSLERAQAHDGLIAAHMAFLLKLACPGTAAAQAALRRDVDLCALRHRLLSDRSACSAADLAPVLAARGHAVALLKSEGGGAGTAAFRRLRHAFLLVTAAPAAAGPPLELLVDPHFACQFVVASPTARYAALLAALPQTFVGTAEQLGHVVEWACREMAASFKQQGQALPPWREHRAMQTKWQPRNRQPGSPGATDARSPRSPLAPCSCCQAGEPCCGDDSPRWAPRGAHDGAHLPSGPSTPTQHAQRPGTQLSRTSLLSRSLEAAGLRRSASGPADSRAAPPAARARGAGAQPVSVPPSNWWELRIRVVRPAA